MCKGTNGKWLVRLGFMLGLAVFVFDKLLLLPALQVTRAIPAGAMSHEEGHLYSVNLTKLERQHGNDGAFLKFVGDNINHLVRSNLVLMEDGVELPFPHMGLAAVASVGGGRYSHWGKFIFFSASDNSSPLENGRTYSFCSPLSVTYWPKFLAFLVMLPWLLSALRRHGPPLRLSVSRAMGAWKRGGPADCPLRPRHVAALFTGIGFSWAGLFVFPEILPEVRGGITQMLVLAGLWVMPLLMAASLFRPKAERWLVPVLLCLAVILFHLPLFDNWHGLRNDWGILLPVSDANGYYHGSLSLLDSGHLTVWNQRRPITAALAAVRLWVSGDDLRVALALQATLVALAVLFAARQVARRFGLAASALLVLLCADFIEPYIPTLLSESTGLFWGAIGLGFLWRAVEDTSSRLFGLGVFFLSLGLLARAGPFFVLPALLLWAFLFHRGRQRLLWCGSVVAGIAGAFALNWLYLHILGTGENVANSNFGYVLYGMSVGGKGWMQLQMDHPELTAETPEHVRAIYDIAMANILNAPGDFIGYLWGQLMAAPGFVMSLPSDFVFPFFATGLGFLAFTGLHRKSALLLLVFAGIVASAPLIMQDGYTRVFAAVIPLLALFPSVAAGFVQSVFSENPGIQERAMPAPGHRGIAALAAILALYAFMPFALVGGRGKMPPVEPSMCPSGQIPVPLVAGLASFLRVHPDGELPGTLAPDIPVSTYTRILQGMDFFSDLGKPQAPFVVATFYCGRGITCSDKYALLEGRLWTPEKDGRYILCVAGEGTADVGAFMRVQSIHEISQ